MFQSLRAEIDAVCQEADQLLAESEQDEWLQAKRSAPAGVDVREWVASRAKRAVQKPLPQPQQSAGMDQETSDAWNAWMTTYVKAYADERFEAFSEMLGEELAKMFKWERDNLRKEFDEQLGALRAEVEILRSVIKSANVTPLKSDRDAA